MQWERKAGQERKVGSHERVKAHPCVGDHPYGVAGPEEPGGVGGGLTASRRELAGECTDRQEHDRGRHHSQGEIEGRPGRDVDAVIQAGQPGNDASDRPQREDATLVGSSRTSRSARVISAAIKMTFCRFPLE